VTTDTSSSAVTSLPALLKGPSLVGNVGDNEKSKGNSGKAKASSKKRKRGAEPENAWEEYVEAEEDVRKGKGGPACDNLVYRLSQACYCKEDLNRERKLARCVGMEHGCDETQVWPRQKGRWLDHFSQCQYISSEDRQEASARLAKNAPSTKLAVIEASKTVTKKTHITSTPNVTETLMASSSSHPIKFKPSDNPSSVYA